MQAWNRRFGLLLGLTVAALAAPAAVSAGEACCEDQQGTVAAACAGDTRQQAHRYAAPEPAADSPCDCCPSGCSPLTCARCMHCCPLAHIAPLAGWTPPPAHQPPAWPVIGVPPSVEGAAIFHPPRALL